VSSKQHILAEIRRLAAENGAAPGAEVFVTRTGIAQHTWHGKHWRSWSDALIEAGFSPNSFIAGIPETELVLALIALTKKLRRVPAEVDLKLEHRANPAFPSTSPFRRLGGQARRMEAIRRYVTEHQEHADVLPYLPASEEAHPDEPSGANDSNAALVDGHVYMLKLGKHYKIGRSESVPTRHRQINLELPEKAELVHKIGTDDAVGIETYWHQRFASKRTNGEWFTLTRQDVAAFKRRKFM
jgi:Meiotically up-regulated gene 113/Homing endonuclease associated repeat